MGKLTLDSMIAQLSGEPGFTIQQVLVPDTDMGSIGVRRNQQADKHLLWCVTASSSGASQYFYAHKVQDALRKAVEWKTGVVQQ